MARKLNQRLRDLDKPSASGRGKGGSAPPSFGKDFDPEPPVELAAFIMFAFFGTLILVGLSVLFGVRDVQEDLENRTIAALGEVGITDVEVTASGFDISIIGSVDVEEQLALVGSISAGIEGVREVSTNVIYEPPRETVEIKIVAEPLVVSWSSGRAVASGTFSDQATVEAVVAVIDDVFPLADTTALAVQDGVQEEDAWLSTVMSLVRHMADETPDGEIIVNSSANLIQVSAEFETRQKQRDVRDDVEDLLAAVTFDFSSGITAKDVVRVTAEEVAEAQETLDQVIEGKVVEFEFGSSVITSEGQRLLDELLDALREHPLVGVEIAGHTDDVGEPDTNLVLSRERADAVLAYLVARGEDPARFVVVGYGESQPVASNATSQGQARNRRIEFIALLDEAEDEEE